MSAENKVYVKLHDRGGCFYDQTQPDSMVTGENIVELVKTRKVTDAIRGTHLDACTKAEYDAQGKGPKAQAKAHKDAEDEETLTPPPADEDELDPPAHGKKGKK